MEILTNVLVLVHLIGMAGIVGGWISLRARRVESGMGLSVVVWGARFQILSGLALVGIHESQGHALNHAKVGVKLAVALACAAAAEMAAAKARKGTNDGNLIDYAGVLGILNTAIAALWETSGADAS
ncbi:hypothetical protein [Nostocoides sp.]|jgi:hypothetical protein|uniref:hypothetical protein n=1 Tax=Nostocoides sp. TaxID=1917966 RepID=UPI002BB84D84|nr:hypothetical protein [Tetrasphaera sp.]